MVDLPPDNLIIWTGIPTDQRGASGSCWVSIGGVDNAAYGKRVESGATGFVVFNELICYRIGQQLRLPIADGLVHRVPGENPFFAQLNFNRGGDIPPGINGAEFVAEFPDLSGGIIAFDILTMNTDRHAGNLALLKRSGQQSRPFVFDHSHALFGPPGQSGPAHHAADPMWLGCDGNPGNRNCLLEHMTASSPLIEACNQVQRLTDDQLKQMIFEARGHGLAAADAKSILTTLQARRKSIHDIVKHNRSMFPGITQWDLEGLHA